MAKEWWQGDQGAVTNSYGTFEPRPAAPEPTLLDELITSDDDEVVVEPPTKAPVVNPNQGYIDMLKRQLMSTEGRLRVAMINGDEREIKSLRVRVMQKRNEIQQKEYSWSQGQGG